MPPSRIAVSEIRNKHKREDAYRSRKHQATQDKLKRRLAQAKREADDPEAAVKRRNENQPKTLDNTREYHPSMLVAESNSRLESASGSITLDPLESEAALDVENDPFASFFASAADPEVAPKVLVTTSKRATRASYEFCEDLTAVFPGAEFIRRKKGAGFEVGHIAEWCGRRGYSALIVVNEDNKKPDALTVVHLPNGPTAYFRLTSIQLSRDILGHARETAHFPELVLNNFATRLGHAVGRLFQSLFPPLPEFEGRQVVTLHNQRDFLFFRRHRYMFKSTEKTALQEIGPRFTLKLRWLKKGIPIENDFRSAVPEVQLQLDPTNSEAQHASEGQSRALDTVPQEDEYEWQWNANKAKSRRDFSL